jgi:hypothetical protein
MISSWSSLDQPYIEQGQIKSINPICRIGQSKLV